MKELVIVSQIVSIIDATRLVTIHYHGSILKARILESTGVVPTVGAGVIAQLIPGSSEYFIVALT